MEPYVLGIDIGTGSTKALAIDYGGKVIRSAQHYYETTNPSQGFSEQDPVKIWEAFKKCINEITIATAQAPVLISLSSCMHSIILLGETNDSISPLITWADTRSEKIAYDLRTSPTAEKIYRETGTPIHAMSPLCKIIWFRKNAPGIFEKASKFISIKEYIWFKIFNCYEIDYSIASATGLFNIAKFDWDQDALDLCKINSSQLSKPVQTSFVRTALSPSASSLLNIPADTSFCIGASDGSLALVGSNAILPGVAALTIGTSGAVRIASASPIYNFPSMNFNYLLDNKIFICGGAINNGGNVLDWIFKTFFQNPQPDEKAYKHIFENIADVQPGCNGLIFLPYIYGERAPIWDEESCGVFFGIRSYHSPAHFARAAIEGICFSLLHVLEHIDTPFAPIVQLNVSGGIIHSYTWLQILADISEKKIQVVTTGDASALGAAVLGMRSTGIINDYQLPSMEQTKLIEPGSDNHVYKKSYQVFRGLYNSLKDSMHYIHSLNC